MSTEWQFLVTLNERLSPLRDPIQIQDVAVHLIGEHLQASGVRFAQVEGNEFVVKRSYAHGARPASDRGPVALLGENLADACRRGETAVVNDVQTDPRLTQVERRQLLETGIAAFIEVPLL